MFAQVAGLDSPIFNLLSCLEVFKLDAQPVHEVPLLVDLDNKHLLQTVEVQDFTCFLDAFIMLISHRSHTLDWFSFFNSSTEDFPLQNFTLTRKVIKKYQPKRVLDPSLAVFFNFSLELQNGLKVYVELHKNLAEGTSLVKSELNVLGSLGRTFRAWLNFIRVFVGVWQLIVSCVSALLEKLRIVNWLPRIVHSWCKADWGKFKLNLFFLIG